MLEQLHVKNYALIDEVEVQFNQGFNVLTGETGAGKSILIGSVGLLLGQKGDSGVIREGAEQLEVTGIIRLEENSPAFGWLSERDIVVEDGVLVIRRTLKTNGRGNCYIQGTPVNRSDLAEFTSGLIDLHGQHEHQAILASENQRKLLDRFGGSEALDQELFLNFQKLTLLKKEFEDLNSKERDRLREMDLLKFAIQEIDDASLSSGEDVSLEKERALLNQSEKLFQFLNSFIDKCDESEYSLLKMMGEAMGDLNGIAGIDPSLMESHTRFESSYYEIEDVISGIKSYSQEIDFSPERLEFCETRLSEIRHLQKKYADTISGLIEYRNKAEDKLETLINWENRQEEFISEIQKLELLILEQAGVLSGKRREASERLGGMIQDRIRRLGMAQADFEVLVEKRVGSNGKPSCSAHGYDRIEFRISPNKGEALKPLKNIASGGEVSRVMLAVKSVLAETDDIKSLIFDEVDAGIGGEVALAVGEHIMEIAGHSQVLCITHLASIAVRADNHLKVEKGVEGERTITSLKPVSGDQRCSEIARMLSGDSSGEMSLGHARELLEKYRPSGF
ncbi:MAG: DNA repair protein RecN [Spirochaetales bacterium]|nr:DNA repair protein RecN [Spirochaetales bacterium]